MIGKVKTGGSFGGAVGYCMKKEDAELLDKKDVRDRSIETITEDFEFVRSQREDISKPVWHASISFAYDDKLTNDQMIKIGRDYIEQIGLKDHQYIMVRHHDTRHDHIHIIANRIGWEGDVTSDKWCKNRTARICDLMEEKYGLTVAKKQHRGKSIDNDKIPIKKKVKVKIHQAITKELENGVSDFNKLKASLKGQGIELNFHTQKSGNVIGITFRTNGLTVKGSAIDKSLSFKNLAKRLSQNQGHHKKYDHGKPMEM